MKSREEIYKHFPFAELKSSDGKSRIRICTYNYEFPDAEDKWDADWYLNLISVDTDKIKADINEPVIEGRVLRTLLDEAIEFSELKTSEFDFSFTEPTFSFVMRNENMSAEEIEVNGAMMERENIIFRFETDINSINTFISGIRQILKQFPPRF